MKPYRKHVTQLVPAVAPEPEPEPENTWEAAVAAFLYSGRDADRQLRQATLDNYTFFLLGERTTDFRQEHKIVAPADMTKELLRAFERELQDAGAAPGTVGSYHRCLKNFVGFCIREGHGGNTEAVVSLTKTLTLKSPKMPQPEMAKFTDAEIVKMRAALARRPRDLMLVNLLLGTGLRLAEVADLTLNDLPGLDLKGKALVHVKEGKGGKIRDIPLHESLRLALVHYKAKVRVQKGRAQPGTQALFLTDRAEGGAQVELSTSAIQTLMHRLGSETGIHVNPHKFRHTFASHALTHGLDVMALQKALGHTTLDMVSRYVHKDTSDLQRAMAGWED